jgi:tRNA (guanine37-N1)-methyltransferase
MIISIITLFPDFFKNSLSYSILKRAQEKGLVEFRIIDHRDFGEGRHKVVDDKPYGGGSGMILKVDVLKKAIDAARLKGKNEKIVLLCPQGKVFTQEKAEKLSKLEHVIFVSGHYEGFDERIREFVDEEISIGDYVLTGGELPAMVVVDSLVRLIPGVLKDKDATKLESHSEIFGERILEGPQYTRPEEFESFRVPEVFLSGDPKKITEYKSAQAIVKTKKRRPDLIKKTS